MADPGWSTRLRAVLGVAPHEVEEEHLQALVDAGVRENADLDFKRDPYGKTDGENRELAADIGGPRKRPGRRAGHLGPGRERGRGPANPRRAGHRRGGARAPGRDGQCHALRGARYTRDRVARRPSQGLHPPSFRPAPSDHTRSARITTCATPGATAPGKRCLPQLEVDCSYKDRFARAMDDVERVGQVMREGLAAAEYTSGSAASSCCARCPLRRASCGSTPRSLGSVEEGRFQAGDARCSPSTLLLRHSGRGWPGGRGWRPPHKVRH